MHFSPIFTATIAALSSAPFSFAAPIDSAETDVAVYTGPVPLGVPFSNDIVTRGYYEKSTSLEARGKLGIKLGFVTNAASPLFLANGLYAAIGKISKWKSDNKECDVSTGSIDKTNWQLRNTGQNCDTQASEDDITKAVQLGIEYMVTHQGHVACFEFSNGGTWRGLLAIGLNGATLSSSVCTGVLLLINI